MDDIIQFKDVAKEYNGRKVIENINLSLAPGTITSLIGANGSGKTTIARLILGIEDPSKGSISRKGDIKIGYVPQKIEFNRNMPMNVESFLRHYNYQAPLNSKQVNQLLDKAQLSNFSQSSIYEMSGGQVQKLLLLAAMSNKPDLLILDEAVNGLDISAQEDFYNNIEREAADFNTAILMISHDLYTVMRKSYQVLCLNKHICCRGTPSEVSKHKSYMEIFGNKASHLSPYIHHHDHEH